MSRTQTDELLKTVFVSGFPKSLSNNALEKALTVFPGFSKLQRPLLYDGSPSEFGFIAFSTAAGVNQALRVLPQIHVDSNDKPLLATAEKSTFEWLSRAPGTDPTIANDPNVIAKFSSDLNSSVGQNGSVDSTYGSKSKNEEEGDVYEIIRRSQAGEDKTLEDIEIDEKDLPRIKEEIAKFREESLKFEKKRDQDALNYEKRTQGRTMNMSSFAKTNTNIAGDEDKLIDVDIKYDDMDEIPPGDEGDKQVLELKEAKKAQQMHNRFEIAEKKWIQREEYRSKVQERNKESASVELTEEEKKARVEKYRLFDENDPHVRRHMDYYTHHSQWENSRREFRKREIELDERDAKQEEKELGEVTIVPEEPETVAGKISLSFKGSKKNNGPGWSETETTTVSSGPKTLPSGIEELTAFPIKWENVDETVLESIIRPAVVSDIVEYLGVEEEDLIEFVVNHIREHKPLTELATELEATLDEDAQIVAEHVWRLLVEATESKEEEGENGN